VRYQKVSLSRAHGRFVPCADPPCSDCQSFSVRAWSGVNYPVCFNDGLQQLLASPVVVARSDCQSFSARAWAGVNYPVCFNDGLQQLLASPVVAAAVVLFAAAAAERYADRDWEWRETQEEPTASHRPGCREARFLLAEVSQNIRMAK
jgi:hypothetical protein